MFDKLFNRSNGHQQPQLSFHERRQRSRSAEPARKNRESDIFNRRTQVDSGENFSSEYKKSFSGHNGNDHKQNGHVHQVVIAERPATALSFMLDEPDTVGVSRSITLDQIAADNSTLPRDPQLDAQLAAVSERLLINQQQQQHPKYRSIFGRKAGSNILFQEEPVVTEQQLIKQSKKTEYKSKFKPFSTYVYLPGNGWIKTKQLRPTSAAASCAVAASNISAAVSTNGDQVDGAENVAAVDSQAIPWYEEVAERNQKANQYRSRSQFGNPILGKF